MRSVEQKILTGVLELDVTQSSSGENVYTIGLLNNSGDSLYKQLNEFLDENVKITIEKLG